MTDEERIAELEAQVQRLERDLAQMQRLRRDAVTARNLQAERLRKTREKLERLQARRTVRLAVGLSDRMRPLTRAGRRFASIPRRAAAVLRPRRPGRPQPAGARRSPEEEAELGAAILRDLVPATVTNGPLVSIIILNRDGRTLLERCLSAVARTTYRDIEIIVVDNGSTDGSPEVVEGLSLPFPVRVIRNPENRSFSDANGQAAAVAQGELLCFLNNDIEPITDDWLGYMVETLTTERAIAVGARLIYPASRGRARAGARFDDLTLQHRGVAFDRTEPVPWPRVMGAGEDPRSHDATAIVERPALTAACLLVPKAAFDAVGGFGSGYDYGLEDMDLCLALRAGDGRLVYDGRAALWHHESATRAADPAVRRRRVRHNRETYLDHWGPRLFRDAVLDAIAGGVRYSSAPFHIAIAVPTDGASARARDLPGLDDLAEALEHLGWRVSHLPRAVDGCATPDASVEAVIVLDDACDIRRLDRRLITLALIGDRADPWLERPWFDDFDIVIASDQDAIDAVRGRSAKVARPLPMAADEVDALSGDHVRRPVAAIRDALIDWASVTRYGLRIGVPSWDVAASWGDYHFARGLQRSLERAGHPTRVHFQPDWDSATAARDDVAIHVLGRKDAPTRSGQVNILWQISHPDLASPESYERYDHVFVASDAFAAQMAERVAVPVTPLHQATDPERMRPTSGGPRHELLFVANSRMVHRRIVDDLADTTHDLAIYGANWTPDLVDPRFVKGSIISSTDLARYYGSAVIVLNDHWDDMLAEGFISNRIYDALACGAFVISDHIGRIEPEFDDAVVTYTDRDDLKRLIDRYLADPDERARRAARGRAAVLARHTFDARAAVLIATASALLPVARSR